MKLYRIWDKHANTYAVIYNRRGNPYYIALRNAQQGATLLKNNGKMVEIHEFQPVFRRIVE